MSQKRLKKPNGNVLIQHLSEKCDLCVSPFCQVVQKHTLFEVVQ